MEKIQAFYSALSAWGTERFDNTPDKITVSLEDNVPDDIVNRIDMMSNDVWCETMATRHRIPEWFNEVLARVEDDAEISLNLIDLIASRIMGVSYNDISKSHDKSNCFALAILALYASDEELKIDEVYNNNEEEITMENNKSSIVNPYARLVGGIKYQATAHGTIKGSSIKSFVYNRLGAIPGTNIAINVSKKSGPNMIPFTCVFVEIPYEKAITRVRATTINEAMKPHANVDACLVEGAKPFMFDPDYARSNISKSNTDTSHKAKLTNIGLDVDTMNKIDKFRNWTQVDCNVPGMYGEKTQMSYICIVLDIEKIMNAMCRTEDGKQIIYNLTIVGGKFYDTDNGQLSRKYGDDEFEYKWFGTFDPNERVSFKETDYKGVTYSRLI